MRNWIMAGLLLIGSGANAGADTESVLKELKFDKLNQAAPDFEFADDAGKPLHLSDGGRVPTILHLWATWCVPCQKEMPELVKFAKNLPNQNFRLLIVAVDNEAKRETVAHDLKKLNLELPVYVVRKSDASKKYFGWGIPMTYIIDSGGKIVARVSGSRDWSKIAPEKFEKLISGLSTKKEM